jgi:hypothetical protein
MLVHQQETALDLGHDASAAALALDERNLLQVLPVKRQNIEPIETLPATAAPPSPGWATLSSPFFPRGLLRSRMPEPP